METADLPKQISELSLQERALLFERLQKRKAAGGPAHPSIPRQPRETNSFPLSFAQQRLWFLQQFDPGSPAYNIPLALRLCGSLSLPTLEQSLNQLLERHEVLRTAFVDAAGEPAQVIIGRSTLPLSVVNLQQTASDEQERTLQELMQADIARPFDLASWPLLRATIFQLSSSEHIILLTLHHIISDGWSMGIVARELTELYAANVAGRPALLASLPVQYADYAVWQRAQLQGELLERQLSYWKAQLAGVQVLELPTDHPRPAIRSTHGASCPFSISQELTAALKQLSQQQEVSLFMTLLAAFQLLLSRYSGQCDIAIGTPIAGRTRAELEGVIGFFINTLVLRTDLTDIRSFSQLLGRVRETCLGAYAHQELPFEQLVDQLQPARDLSHTPLFQVMLSLQNMPGATVTLDGVSVEPMELAGVNAKFDLTLSLCETSAGLAGSLDYNTDLFEASSVERLGQHLQTLLAEITARPDIPLEAITLLSAADREQMLVSWNDTQANYPHDTAVHLLFEQQASRDPAALAVVFGEQRLSYGELDARANQLAQQLRAYGARQETRVAICLEPCIELVISVLAVFKAGTAYIPLDPSHPAERLAFMLADAQVALLLTTTQLLEQLPAALPQAICLDRDWPTVASQPVAPVAGQVSGDQLAYIIYTSGSTGTPKGVQVSQRALVNFLCAMQHQPGFQQRDVLLAITTIAFDIAGLELYLPLISGGQVVLASRAEAVDGTKLLQALERSGATLMQATPASWQMLLESGWQGDQRLTILCGGEALSLELAGKLRSRCAALWNMYGPTETTIWSSIWQVQPGSSLIGRPIANTQIYLLDSGLQPVPVGVAGELYIGGDGLARGYLNRPALTAEKFLPNPFVAATGARMYRSGDLARYRDDGTIEYLGRLDQQVKLRGFRIELGEIEQLLSQHPALAECVVVAREDMPGQKRLVAYIRGSDAELPQAAELRALLKRRLPDYMLPSLFIPLERFPLTPNGKIDRKALPTPQRASHDPAAPDAAPRTPAEQSLARIWQQVLHLEHVGIHENFFALGGDSLLSLQLVARAQQVGLRVTPQLIFQHQTIAELAAALDSTPVPYAEQDLVVGPMPLTPIQQLHFSSGLANPHYHNLPFLAELLTRPDAELLKQAVWQIMLHHDILRARFVQEQESWSAFISAPDGQEPPVSWHDLSALAVAEQGAAIEQAIERYHHSLNLSQGPLFRAAYFDLGASQPGRLLLLFHHFVVDRLATSIIIGDLLTAYSQLSSGQRVNLPRKTTSVRYWAERLSNFAQTPQLLQEADYWLGLPWEQAAHLPDDLAGREQNTQGSLQSVLARLSAAATGDLLREVQRRPGTQALDLVVTALGQAFEPWLEGRPLLIDLVRHGREALFDDVDLSRTAGWFIYFVPVFLSPSLAEQPVTALRRVQDQLRRIPNNGIGYGLLRYLCSDQQLRQRFRALPYAEVQLNFIGNEPQTEQTAGFLRPAGESTGGWVDPRNKRHDLFWCQGGIINGQLELKFLYSGNMYRQASVEALTERFLDALRSLIAACSSREVDHSTARQRYDS